MTVEVECRENGAGPNVDGWTDSLWTRTFDRSADEPWQFRNRYPDPTPEHYRSQRFVIQIRFMTAMFSKPENILQKLLHSFAHELTIPGTLSPDHDTGTSIEIDTGFPFFFIVSFIAQSGNS